MSGSRDPLGDRMKRYEEPTRFVLPRRTYTVVRVDGRAFHTFLRHVERPFDSEVTSVMRATAERMCPQLSGCVLAYTQSDEISLVLRDFETTTTEPWFGGVVQKIASVAASTATAIFTEEYRSYFDLPRGANLPTFDARAFTVPDVVEVANYLVWRQRDCERNSVLALAQHTLGHRRVQGRSVIELRQRMLTESQVDWYQLEPWLRRGWLVRRVRYVEAEQERSRWEAFAAPELVANGDGLLVELLPDPPRLRSGDV